tara:strand:+ start:1201 stop:1818 length:618 start_codon:yes stop_codon:yes gene_type:complete
MTNLLKIEELSCQRSNNLIFSNLSFDVQKGKNVEIVGSNGSGKTTLLRCLLGLTERKEGEILWKGQPMEESKHSFFKSCLYQGHQLALKPSFTVIENLIYSHLAFNLKEEEILSAIKDVGLANLKFRSSSDLSMGQLKRLAIAKWLMSDHELYLIDEPFASLDNEGVDLVLKAIKELNSRGCSFLFTSHSRSKVDSKEIILDNYL